MTPTRPSDPAVNEAADRLRDVLAEGDVWAPEEPGVLIEAVVIFDAALVTERRNTVERIRAQFGALRGSMIYGDALDAILDEIAS